MTAGIGRRGKVFAVAAVSVDGYVADLDDQVGPLFDWYGNGPVAITLGDPDRVFKVSQASAAYLEQLRADTAVAVIGRRLFDLTDGWGGVPAAGEHVVVVTHSVPHEWVERHPDAPYSFVTDGVEAAVELAHERAGGGQVSVTGGDIAGQAFDLGLLDEVRLNLTPVVAGRGRPFFGRYAGPLAELGDPEVIQGDRVIHLIYPVRRSDD